jgi:hypothetical protein
MRANIAASFSAASVVWSAATARQVTTAPYLVEVKWVGGREGGSVMGRVRRGKGIFEWRVRGKGCEACV